MSRTRSQSSTEKDLHSRQQWSPQWTQNRSKVNSPIVDGKKNLPHWTISINWLKSVACWQQPRSIHSGLLSQIGHQLIKRWNNGDVVTVLWATQKHCRLQRRTKTSELSPSPHHGYGRVVAVRTAGSLYGTYRRSENGWTEGRKCDSCDLEWSHSGNFSSTKAIVSFPCVCRCSFSFFFPFLLGQCSQTFPTLKRSFIHWYSLLCSSSLFVRVSSALFSSLLWLLLRWLSDWRGMFDDPVVTPREQPRPETSPYVDREILSVQQIHLRFSLQLSRSCCLSDHQIHSIPRNVYTDHSRVSLRFLVAIGDGRFFLSSIS